jgi:hypothetical protein
MLKQQNAGAQGSAPAGVVVALNWFEQLKARAK